MEVEKIYSDPNLYDAEFATRLVDVNYYRGLVAPYRDPILEVGCGTGRIAIPIAQSGKQITGIDLVPGIIAQAKTKAAHANLNIPFLIKDCRMFDLNQRFKIILCVANTLQHLLVPSDVTSFLDCAAQHLSWDGQLIIEVINPNPEKLIQGKLPYKKKSFLFNGSLVDVWCKCEYKGATKILKFNYTYVVQEIEIGQKDIEIRCFDPAELKDLLRTSGWQIDSLVGDYNSSAFVATFPLQIMHCSRIK